MRKLVLREARLLRRSFPMRFTSRRVRVATLTLCAAFLLSSAGDATTLVHMSLAQLAQAATVIVRGRVTSQVTRWNAQHTRIFTFTTVSVEETLKGHPSSTVVIQQPGGTIGHFHVLVPGTVHFRPTGQYVLFLEPGPKGRYLPVGMAQGAYRVFSGKTGVARLGLPFGTLPLGEKSQQIGPTPTLGEFDAAITRVLSQPISIPPGTMIPVVIDRTSFRGVGRFGIEGHTLLDLFPSHGVVIPAGSRIEGLAQRVGPQWQIFWNEVTIRGESVRIQATSEQAANTQLLGRSMIAQVR